MQFDSVEGLLIPHIGLIWERFRSKFPLVEQHPPIAPIVERSRPAASTSGKLSFSTAVETPRVWFVASDGAELVQIQTNRFVRNWRKSGISNRKYPNYEPHIRPNFLSDLQLFQDTIAELGFEKIKINQCEITYVNHILPGEGWSKHSDVGKVLRDWPSDVVNTVGDGFESAAIKLSKRLVNENGEFFGRLHFDLQPGYRAVPDKSGDQLPIFVSNIVARGKPLGTEDDGIVDFFDAGRREIVLLFDKIFSQTMQQAWGRKEI